MKPFSLVVAMDKAGGIGKAGTLPWHLPPDLKHFKEITMAVSRPGLLNAVIMGRKTWDSLPGKFRPLPGRLNIVLTRSSVDLPADTAACPSLQKALDFAFSQPNVEQAFVIGGGQIFALALQHPDCRAIFATLVEQTFDCDTFLGSIPARFKRVDSSPQAVFEGISYRFVRYLA